MHFDSWGENALHRWLIERFPRVKDLGLGDDAAVVAAEGERVAVTVDVTVEGVHFRRQWMSWREVGRRATLANISDLAPACAQPALLMASIGVPPAMEAAAVREAIEGIAEAGEEFGAMLAGGDTSAAPVFFVDVTAVGWQQAAWRRSGGRDGDVLAVTGALGGAAAAVALLEAGAEARCQAWAALRERLVNPRPRVPEALALADAGVEIHAAMDISDGLALDATRMCQASGVGGELWASAIPINEGVQEAAALVGGEAVQIALTGGEDYELLLALPEAEYEKAREVLEGVGCRLTCVGRLREGEGLVILDASGKPMEMGRLGYEHYG